MQLGRIALAWMALGLTAGAAGCGAGSSERSRAQRLAEDSSAPDDANSTASPAGSREDDAESTEDAEVGVADDPSDDATSAVEDEAPVVLAGPICEGNFAPVRQAELDALRNCVEIVGWLLLDSSARDLEPLSHLEVVRGGVQIRGLFQSLEGLHSLRQAGSVGISDTRLSDLSGLRSLTTLVVDDDHEDRNGRFSLSDDDAIESLAGLESLESFAGVHISQTANLRTLDGLTLPESLESVSLVLNDSLKSTALLSSVRELGTLRITHNDSLQIIDGLENLERVDYLDIDGNASVRTIASAPALTTAGFVAIEQHDHLQQIDAFASLSQVDELHILRNSTLTQLSFPELSQASSIVIGLNAQLSSQAAEDLAAQTNATSIKIARNQDDSGSLSPCPWVRDGVCDEYGVTDFCVEGTDQIDCKPGAQ